ncbi:hypothetical protein ND861_02055 [Leptospira sp. 2 VSF19]|uniref:ERV/ALR sulfhydryl oxidase domain-containing protein n=1 Tax=Leptospira soteropolitanensis TaxID=2950025 RepID=A0AAW5VIK6_9LEPT|nr:hypothetical protein [Leptospira soteropolitanensis]MCW7491430.1 hypothetical protein [Leptospira soteropolitanensis]MCW7499014.1 hypothetical protein [Leptospira soteropolitanensis]MCW7521394.1 hypothetical protein [Leptospira soteropolitanensis]MCW7525118.1 hypothetical protein [Leptospira soteropolitanensis]MCW7528985.1 hypothetical protein [Leptospira soteropolitanensis]
MSCLFCQKGTSHFSRLEPVVDERQTHIFPTEDIVGNSLNPFTEIYECKDCHSIWWIKTRGTGDPRSTYPEFYEQTALLIDDHRSELIRNPSISGILKNKDLSFPYSFFEEVLEILKETKSEELKTLYYEREPSLPANVKRWLLQWFQKHFPLEFQTIQKQGFPSSANLLLTLEEDEFVVVSEFIAKEQFAFITSKKDKFFLQSYDLTDQKILWKISIRKPFLEGLSIPILFYQSGYLCSYQGYQKGSEYYPKLNRPNTLCIYDLFGNLILSLPLAFNCYEVLSTEERDVSENRISHNFNFTIFDDLLFLPYQTKIQVYDLKSGKLNKTIKMPAGEIFSGKAFKSESENILFHTLKGILGINSSGAIIFQYLSSYHPVFIDSQFQMYYYYAIIESANTGEKKTLKQTTESGISLVRELASLPVEFPGGIYLSFSFDGSLLLNSEMEIIKNFPFTATDTLGPHSFGITKTPTIVTEDRIIITNDFSGIYMIDFSGNVLLEKSISSEVLSVFTFDGKHTIVLLSFHDDYSNKIQTELLLLTPKGEILAQKILTEPKGLSVSFDGICIFSEHNQMFAIDLFAEDDSL